MSVITITNVSQWNEIIKIAANSILIIKCSTSWCMPCKVIQPKYQKLAEQYKNEDIIFMTVDIEEVPDIAEKFNISSMPTFLIIQNDAIKRTVIGADILSIKTGIDILINGL
jgi:thioredoxin 1